LRDTVLKIFLKPSKELTNRNQTHLDKYHVGLTNIPCKCFLPNSKNTCLQHCRYRDIL